MKKIYSWMTVMAAVLSLGFTSCSDNDEPKKEESAAPELLSFSFNVAENSEVLSADCVGVISDADKTVKVTMPAFADKSSLIATFTVAEGNTVQACPMTRLTVRSWAQPLPFFSLWAAPCCLAPSGWQWQARARAGKQGCPCQTTPFSADCCFWAAPALC